MMGMTLALMIFIILSAVLGYLLGSLNSAVIVSKLKGMDIREHGSGNAGTTNVLRVMGKTSALLVLLGDMIKGILACFLAYSIGRFLFGMDQDSARNGLVVAGTLAVIGHNWPVYFGFKGGKGVLTTFAVVLCFDWKIALISLSLFIVLLALTKYVSLGSMAGAVLFFVLVIVFGRDIYTIVLSGILAVMIVVRHKANIKKLLSGQESKITDRLKTKKA